MDSRTKHDSYTLVIGRASSADATAGDEADSKSTIYSDGLLTRLSTLVAFVENAIVTLVTNERNTSESSIRLFSTSKTNATNQLKKTGGSYTKTSKNWLVEMATKLLKR